MTLSICDFTKKLILYSVRQIFPPKCWKCQSWLPTTVKLNTPWPFFCDYCYSELSVKEHYKFCPRCGMPSSEIYSQNCANCIDLELYFDRTWCGFLYENDIREWILQLKYGKKIIFG